jgi:hypothetical protein
VQGGRRTPAIPQPLHLWLLEHLSRTGLWQARSCTSCLVCLPPCICCCHQPLRLAALFERVAMSNCCRTPKRGVTDTQHVTDPNEGPACQRCTACAPAARSWPLCRNVGQHAGPAGRACQPHRSALPPGPGPRRTTSCACPPSKRRRWATSGRWWW